MSSITQHIATVGSCTLNCLQARGGNRKSIILLHGASFSAATWQELGTLDCLAQEGFDVHALDMPGFGESPECRASKPDLLAEYIQAFNLNRPVLIGPSRGGRYSQALVFTRPDIVGGLVLVGSVGIEENRDRFKTIDVPCLLVWGSNDAVSPPSNAELLHQEIPNSKLVIVKEGSHPCYLNQPEVWHKELLAFLDANWPACANQ